MKGHYLTKLRSKQTDMRSFREAAAALSLLIAAEVATRCKTAPLAVDTPLAIAQGESLAERVVLVAILRAGIAILPPFMQIFPESPVGFLGIQRDEKTALPQLYYENLPPLAAKDRVLLLDPMIATGGSACLALQRLVNRGSQPSQCILASVLATSKGLQSVQKAFPQVQTFVVAVDEELNAKQFIVPGLGDFGDRYFGTGSVNC